MINALLKQIREDLIARENVEVAEKNKRFFKEGQPVLCYGLKSAEVNKLSKQYLKQVKEFTKKDVLTLCETLWQSGYQEEMSIACALSESLESVSSLEDFEIYTNWLDKYVKNWAMCDTFCNHTIGELVIKYPELVNALLNWTKSNNRWVKRGAAVTLIIAARRGLFLPTVFEIADALLQDTDDMVQKGYGWLLKAASESHEQEVFDFVMERRAVMSRTSLRYAIEKLPLDKRKLAMSKG